MIRHRHLVSVLGGILLLAPLSLAAQELPVHTPRRGEQQCPAVLAHPEGGYLVIFASTTFGNPAGPQGVFAQRLGLSGERIGAELALDSAESSECLTAVPAGPGRLLVAWGVHNGIGQQAIYARYFDFQGTPLSPKLKAGQGMAYVAPGAACDAEARCWIAWVGQGVDSIRARRFAVTGQPLGEEIRVDNPGNGERWDLKLSADPQGGFVASW